MLIRCSFARRPSTVRPGSWQPLLAQPRSETEDTARWVAALRQAAPAPRFSVIRLIKGRPYVGLKCRAAEPGAALPARFLQAGAVTLPLAGIADPAVLARRIEAASGLAVRFAGPPSGDEDISLTESFAGAGIDRLSPEAGVWTGPLDALLDAWTGPAGYDWRYDDDGGAIEIVRRRSVVFRIHALAGRQLYAAAASTSDAAAGGEEGGGVQTDGGAIEIVRRRSVVFRIHALAGRQLYAAAASTSDAAAGGEEGGGVRLASRSPPRPTTTPGRRSRRRRRRCWGWARGWRRRRRAPRCWSAARPGMLLGCVPSCVI